MLTLAMAVSTYLTGWILDHAGLSAQQVASLLGAAFLIPGIAWWLIQKRLDNSAAHSLETSQPIIEIETAD